MPLFSRPLAPRRGESSAVEEYPDPRAFRHASSPQLRAMSSPTPDPDCVFPSQHYAQMVQEHLSPLPSPYRWLDLEDVQLVRRHPIAAGGFADIYEATYDGRKVVLKAYRPYISFDVAQVIARLHHEVHVSSLLHQGGVDVVTLVGVYSTEVHPFGLVYEYMDGLDLGQYIKNEPNAGRLELLVVIARCLSRMHGLGIVHGALEAANILVDKDGTAWIAGLGNTFILPRPTAGTVPENRTGTIRLSRSHAPGWTWPRMSPDRTDPAHPTKADDMYAFGVLAWEVFTGQQPFPNMTETAAAHAMLNGNRPSRQNKNEIPDREWHMIQQCWHKIPSKRMSAGEVVNLLETELGRTGSSRALSPAH